MTDSVPVSNGPPKRMPANVVALAPESIEEAGREAGVLTQDTPTAPPSAGQRSPVTKTRLHEDLALRVRHLTTHTFPIAWYRVTRIGAAGLVGGSAALCAIVVAALAIVGGRQATDALSAQITHVQAHPGELVSGDAGVSKVVATLPRRQDMPAVLGQVLEQAQAANVALDNGRYTYSVPKAGSGVGRYELEFPVKAAYPNVRDFINRTLTAVPAAGLDKLRVERKVVGDPLVSANIRFVVFVRAGPQP